MNTNSAELEISPPGKQGEFWFVNVSNGTRDELAAAIYQVVLAGSCPEPIETRIYTMKDGSKTAVCAFFYEESAQKLVNALAALNSSRA